jgi:hypothetical protein
MRVLTLLAIYAALWAALIFPPAWLALLAIAAVAIAGRRG